MVQGALIDPNLQDFIAKYGGDMLYFDQAWLDLITSLYGYELIQLTTKKSNGQITGFLPLCYLQSAITGRRLVSLPFADYCPLLAEDEASANALLEQAKQLAQAKRVHYLELRAGKNEVLSKRDDFSAGNLYSRYLIPLDSDPDLVWAHFHKSVRGKIRKAQRLGLQVRVVQCREEMLDYYHLHLLTRSKKHGMPSQPLQFFLRLWDIFAPRNMLRVELAEYEGKVVAGSIMGTYNKTAQFLYGASDERFRHLAANNLLTWESIRWCCQQGYKTLDQGRTSYHNPGLMTFKLNWGAIEEALPYYYYPAPRGLVSTDEQSLKYRVLTRCWRMLPLQISGPLGGFIYRHLG
ncbi:MAG TPA: GNAT family N-acetyltransferase [Ktedonobacteraceae bacterium]